MFFRNTFKLRVKCVCTASMGFVSSKTTAREQIVPNKMLKIMQGLQEQNIVWRDTQNSVKDII